jgi:CHAT domain-containing protein/Tfp pilus assembly protein PilF
VQPQALYDRGRQALQRDGYDDAARIARDGKGRFAAQPYWSEMFAVLEAESLARTDAKQEALCILDRTPATGAPLPAVRRWIVIALVTASNEAYTAADSLAARVAPELRPETAARRVVPLYRAGDIDDAERCAQEAIRTAKQSWLLAMAYNALAWTEGDRSRWTPAIEHYTLALKYARIAHAERSEIVAMTNLGWCYLEVGNLDQTVENLQPVIERQSPPIYQHIALVHMAEVYVRRIEYDKALPYARKALAIARKLGAKELANSYLQLGQIELELGHYEAAKKWNDQALATRPGYDRPGALDDHLNEARILAATGNPAQGLQILQGILAAKPDPPTRWRVQGIEARIYEKLGRLDASARMYEATLATGAHARASVESSESSFAFERNFLSFYDGYIDVLLEQRRTAAALAVAERSRARSLREVIGLRSTKDVDAVALARRKNATILYYWLGAKRSLLWTVTPDGVDVAELPADDIVDKAADAYREELQSSRHSLRKSVLGPRLYAMLITPAPKIARSSRVIILPDAHLRALSFDALVVPAEPPHYWIEDVTISYSPSLHLLASTPKWKSVPDGRALVFGDVPAEGRAFPKLKRAGKEIAEVAEHFGPRAVVRSGGNATPSSYAAADPHQFQFIHFAAHATANTEKPLESAVILAPDANGFSLSGDKIVQVPLAAELVTVSSCNSAGRRNYAGEGLVGLAWAFLGAGARRVVAAQWEVNDAAAPRVMDEMYAAIVRDGVEPAEALRRAKLKLLHSNSVHERPLYWAPFAVYGAM